MSCYHPLKGFRIGTTPQGKAQLKIVGAETDHIELTKNGTWNCAPTGFVSRLAKEVVRDSVMIPCGKCLGCRLDYSKQWADRCMLELQNHKSSYFVTLTYDDQHVPIAVDENGELTYRQTLCKRDLQLFWKRLRKSGQEVRYYCCGEYGTDTYRPHYHAIVFGLELGDLKPYRKSSQGFQYYNSDYLTNLWSNGFVVVTEVTYETCAYTARYVMKKQTEGRTDEFYKSFSLEPEFTLMSRRPAIGREYFEKHPEMYDYDAIYLSTASGGKKIKPPRYFDKLFDDLDHDSMQSVKDSRQYVANTSMENQLRGTSLPMLDLLAAKERVKASSIKALKRGDCVDQKAHA